MTENPFDSSIDPEQGASSIEVNPDIVVEEAPIIDLKPIPDQETVLDGKDDKDKFELEVRECEVLYGTLIEIGHSLKSKKESKPLPEQRVKRQGKILYEIFKRYDVQIPNIDLAVLAVGAVADWRYLTTNEIDNEVEGAIINDSQNLDNGNRETEINPENN